MTPENKKELNQHLQAIAKILYEDSDPKKVQNLAGIEETIREQTLQYITPQIGFFLSKQLQELMQEGLENSRV